MEQFLFHLYVCTCRQIGENISSSLASYDVAASKEKKLRQISLEREKKEKKEEEKKKTNCWRTLWPHEWLQLPAAESWFGSSVELTFANSEK